MIKHIKKTGLIMALLLAGSCAFGITAAESFNDGYRSFKMARWTESEEFFTRFLNTWPDHKLKDEAKYYLTISQIRSQDQKLIEINRKNLEQWNESLKTLQKNLPEHDLSELKAAIAISRSTRPTDWNAMQNLPLSEIKHFINRQWHPDPSEEPVKTLKWTSDVLKKHNPDVIDPELLGKIYLIECRAMWKIFLSPLPMHSNSDILKVCGYWPVHTALEKSLSRGFDASDTDTKREIAMLGFYYESFRRRNLPDNAEYMPDKNSKWFSYLSERGINLQEAWFPR